MVVGTLAWNNWRHLEIYYATAGIGAVCHTVNPRLHLDQIVYIINHAEDVILFYDPDFATIIESIRSRCPTVRYWVALVEDHIVSEQSTSHDTESETYSQWLIDREEAFAWPELDENTASGLCYTSGTTGNPKGALYSHRSTVLHAYASCHRDALGISRSHTVMFVVPMFHVNAWGLPYSALMSGAAIVLPGANLKGSALHSLCESSRVTFSAGVPTVWAGVLEYMEREDQRLSTLSQILIGGSSCPPNMITAFAKHGIAVRHAWGMTEVSPLGTVCRTLPKHDQLDPDERLRIASSQGRPLYGVTLRLQDDEGTVLPKNGETAGHLMVRGNWVIQNYYSRTASSHAHDWFQTGDVATIDSDGYLRLVDRSKDVIKSGGEWISSIELENIAMEHSAVAMAACIAEPDEKWGERPLLVIVLHKNATARPDDILAVFQGRIPRWSLPDRIEFANEIPLTATGKIQKTELRRIYLGAN